MTQLYRIEEQFTDDWQLVEETAKGLTREQCTEKLNLLIAEGHNPNYLRVVLDVD